MKKIISLFLTIAIFFTTFVNCFAVTTYYYDDTTYNYQLTPNSKEWGTYETKNEILEQIQIPSNKLYSMTTEALLDTVLNYPYILDYNVFNNMEDAFKTFYNDFNGFRELLSRKDLTEILIKKYKNSEIMSDECYALAEKTSIKDKMALSKCFFITSTLEFLLICDEMQNGRFTEQQRKDILEISMIKNASKIDSKLYSENSCLYAKYNKAKANATIQKAGGIYINSSVLTPKKSKVPTLYNRFPELSKSEKEQLYNNLKNEYPKAKYLSEATVKYNCHSYAWYSQSPSNKHWMNNPALYMSDGSYYKAGGSPRTGMKAFWINGSHSGIVTSINYSGGTHTYYVTSKWGMCGLYEHGIWNCPYSGTVHFYSLSG